MFIIATLCTKVISTHDLTKRSTDSFFAGSAFVAFQLTTSRRGRLYWRGFWYIWKYFNSRPHEEVDYSTPSERKSQYKFQLTTSRRGRPTVVDSLKSSYVISTHDLTKRSTFDTVQQSNHFCISTHDLTKRSTAISYNTTSFKIVFFVLILYF